MSEPFSKPRTHWNVRSVYLAEQTSLARKVAVKKIRADAISDDSVLKLLQEAWVAGHRASRASEHHPGLRHPLRWRWTP